MSEGRYGRTFTVEPLDDMGDTLTLTLLEIMDAGDSETFDAVKHIPVGADVVVGGGAAPAYRLTRTS